MKWSRSYCSHIIHAADIFIAWLSISVKMEKNLEAKMISYFWSTLVNYPVQPQLELLERLLPVIWSSLDFLMLKFTCSSCEFDGTCVNEPLLIQLGRQWSNKFVAHIPGCTAKYLVLLSLLLSLTAGELRARWRTKRISSSLDSAYAKTPFSWWKLSASFSWNTFA